MTKKFPHLTTQIKGRTIIEQPIVFLLNKNSNGYSLIIFSDSFYSILGEDKNGNVDFLKEKDLPTNIEDKLIKKALKTLSKMKLLKEW